MPGDAETIEQTFQGILGQEKSKILFTLAGQVQQSLSDGCRQVRRRFIHAVIATLRQLTLGSGRQAVSVRSTRVVQRAESATIRKVLNQ
jgi:hypothetical protein